MTLTVCPPSGSRGAFVFSSVLFPSLASQAKSRCCVLLVFGVPGSACVAHVISNRPHSLLLNPNLLKFDLWLFSFLSGVGVLTALQLTPVHKPRFGTWNLLTDYWDTTYTLQKPALEGPDEDPKPKKIDFFPFLFVFERFLPSNLYSLLFLLNEGGVSLCLSHSSALLARLFASERNRIP